MQQAAADEKLRAMMAAAAQDAALRELTARLAAVQTELQRAKLEAASVAKQYERSLQRLRREADAGAAEVQRLTQQARQSSAATAGAAGPATSSAAAAQLAGTDAPQQWSMPAGTAAAAAVPTHIQRELAHLRRCGLCTWNAARGKCICACMQLQSQCVSALN